MLVFGLAISAHAQQQPSRTRQETHYVLKVTLPNPTPDNKQVQKYADDLSLRLREHLKVMRDVVVNPGFPGLLHNQTQYEEVLISISASRDVDPHSLLTNLKAFPFHATATFARQTTVVEEFDISNPQQSVPGYPPQGVGSPDP